MDIFTKGGIIVYYYVKLDGNHVSILGQIGEKNLIPLNCIECTEDQYYYYKEQIKIQAYGTIEEQEYQGVLSECRNLRTKEFLAFDIYKTNLFYNLISETEAEKEEIISWYNTWRDLPDTITINNYKDIIYPITPNKIAVYKS